MKHRERRQRRLRAGQTRAEETNPTGMAVAELEAFTKKQAWNTGLQNQDQDQDQDRDCGMSLNIERHQKGGKNKDSAQRRQLSILSPIMKKKSAKAVAMAAGEAVLNQGGTVEESWVAAGRACIEAGGDASLAMEVAGSMAGNAIASLGGTDEEPLP